MYNLRSDIDFVQALLNQYTADIALNPALSVRDLHAMSDLSAALCALSRGTNYFTSRLLSDAGQVLTGIPAITQFICTNPFQSAISDAIGHLKAVDDLVDVHANPLLLHLLQDEHVPLQQGPEGAIMISKALILEILISQLYDPCTTEYDQFKRLMAVSMTTSNTNPLNIIFYWAQHGEIALKFVNETACQHFFERLGTVRRLPQEYINHALPQFENNPHGEFPVRYAGNLSTAFIPTYVARNGEIAVNFLAKEYRDAFLRVMGFTTDACFSICDEQNAMLFSTYDTPQQLATLYFNEHHPVFTTPGASVSILPSDQALSRIQQRPIIEGVQHVSAADKRAHLMRTVQVTVAPIIAPPMPVTAPTVGVLRRFPAKPPAKTALPAAAPRVVLSRFTMRAQSTPLLAPTAPPSEEDEQARSQTIPLRRFSPSNR